MKTFVLVHRDIYLKVICDDEYESIIKQHFLGNTRITTIIPQNPTFTLFITNEIITTKGLYYKMVDKWFNYSTLDCWINNDEKICYIANFHADCITNRNLTIEYFASNLFNRLLELKGYIGIHSSCVEKDGKGIAFIGERLAGKTTCMLNLLSIGFNLVNNDTAAIKYSYSEVEAFGIIKNIFIRMSRNFSMQPQNKKYLKIAESQHVNCNEEVTLEDNRITITHLELANLNHVKLIPSVAINAIIVPRYVSQVSSAKFTLLDTETCFELFDSQVLELVHNTTSFLSELTIYNQESCSVEECISHLVNLPCYLCEQNENTIQSFFDGINNLIY